jgi:hypothetical protein
MTTATPEQLHNLLSYCLDFAKVMLDECGEFFPFGAVVGADGKVKAVGGHNGEEHPEPQEIYRLLTKGFAEGARDGSIVAAALAANVNIPQEYPSPAPDGIRILLESAGYSRYIYSPYRITKRGLIKKKYTIELFDPFPVQISPTLFAPLPDAAGPNVQST